MSAILLDKVNLEYPVRKYAGLTLKEFFVRGFFRAPEKCFRYVHALRDMTLQIHEGERVGIIGHNGAGKSSLLRTIAGVYPLASGTVRVAGSICSLFDITFGFELEATGWENIYYRGYLQGETPHSLQAKIDDIASFTELGDALHLPLRCYSSGMLMRLAFAIATSSEPDILLVDEMFSTGDLAFQSKAKERMQDLLEQARIVVMVSHDLDVIRSFSSRIIWLDHGRIHLDGSPAEVVAAYREQMPLAA